MNEKPRVGFKAVETDTTLWVLAQLKLAATRFIVEVISRHVLSAQVYAEHDALAELREGRRSLLRGHRPLLLQPPASIVQLGVDRLDYAVG